MLVSISPYVFLSSACVCIRLNDALQNLQPAAHFFTKSDGFSEENSCDDSSDEPVPDVRRRTDEEP